MVEIPDREWVLVSRTMYFSKVLFFNEIINGVVAQLVEHLLCKQGVVGSRPSGSTKLHS